MNDPRARKNWALLAVLVAFIVIIYCVTIVRFGGAAVTS